MTTYLYKSPVSGSLLTNIIYPDSPDTDESGSDQIKLTYDRLGRLATRTDQRGTVHTYAYYAQGQVGAARLKEDALTTLASGVDGTVRRLAYTYDDRARSVQFTSYSAASGGSVVNQTQYTFSDATGTWNALTKIQHNPTGSVDANTPAIEYAYSDGASGNDALYLRRTSTTYPGPSGNRRIVYQNFASTGPGAVLSRLDNFADSASGNTKYAQYHWFGSANLYKIDHPAVTGGLTLNFDPDANHSYSALDNLGRLIDHKWTNAAATTVRDRLEYGYDKAGNRVHRHPALDPTRGELYAYDALDRLLTLDRGTLNTNRNGLTATVFKQSWGLDKLGNWSSFKQDDDGDVSGGWNLDQTRSHDLANQVSSLSGGSWASCAYDAAGNLSQAPQPVSPTSVQKYVYDGWQRLVEVRDGSDAVVATYRYNALFQQVRRSVTGGATTDYYHNEAWQVLEERRSGNVYAQWLWDVRYVDAPVCRWRDSNADGSLDETLYAVNDANMNVTALVSPGDGSVAERYRYDAYGQVTFMDGSFAPLTGGAGSTGNYAWDVLYAGYRYDAIGSGGGGGGGIGGGGGLYHVRFRVYHPVLGRWLQRDPLGTLRTAIYGGDNKDQHSIYNHFKQYEDGLNLYLYAGSIPVKNIDPLDPVSKLRS